MPTRTHSFDLPVGPGEAREAAGRAVGELGWDASRNGEALDVREDPVRLSCCVSPVKATISFRPRSVGTSVEMELSVPGFGPTPKSQLADRTAGLEQRITRWAGESSNLRAAQ